MYIGLLVGSYEPSPSTGYCRVEGDLSQTLGFPTSKGYGIVTHIAVFATPHGGEPVETIELLQPVDCHIGVIPLLHEGKLLRGIDVTAQISLKSNAAASV